MNIEAIKAQLKSLRLSAAARGLDDLLIRHRKAVNLDWFTELLQHEIDARGYYTQRLRFQQAGFPAAAAIEHFDFRFNPEIDEAQIRERARLKFIDEHAIVLFLGTLGVGKTHITRAIGTSAHTAVIACPSVPRNISSNKSRWPDSVTPSASSSSASSLASSGSSMTSASSR